MIKKLQILLLATLAIVPLAAKKDKDSVLDSINQRAAYIAKQVTLLNEKQKCSTVIMQKDVGTTGYVIYDSGDYCLGEDITFAPANPATFVPVTFTGGGGSGAEGFAAVSAGIVRGVVMTAGGTGYTSSPTAVFGGTGTGAAAYGGFSIGSIDVVTGGSGYIAPAVIIEGDGQGATAIATAVGGVVTSVTVTNGGGGYTTATAIIFDEAGVGTGATATANLAYGPITGANVTAGGSGYQDTVQAAITILASNVNLQLNNHTLAQAGAVDASTIPSYSASVTNPSSQVPFVIGILIPDTLPTDTNLNAIGLESIYISGDQAVIDGFSMWGMYVFGHNADIRLSNLTIKNSGLLASHYLRPFAGYISNGSVTGVANPGTVAFAVGGLNLGEASDYGMGPQFFTTMVEVAQNRIDQVVMNQVTCLNNLSAGLNASNTTDLYIADSHFDGTFADDPNLVCFGIIFGTAGLNSEDPDILNLTMENSTANGTSFNGDSQTVTPNQFGAVGCIASRTHNFVFRNCTFNYTTSTFVSSLTFSAAGFVNGDVHDGVWENCSFSYLSGLQGTTEAFHMSGNAQTLDPSQVRSSENIRLINCVASNVQYAGSVPYTSFSFSPAAVGFLFAYAKNLYVENCVASDIIANGPVSSPNCVAGILIEGGQNAATANSYEADNHVYRGCIVQRVLTMQGGSAIGIYLCNTTGDTDGEYIIRSIAFEDCIAEGCQAMPTTFPGMVQGAGIGFWSSLQPSLFGATLTGYPITYTNCMALNNTGTTFVANVPSLYADVGNQYSAGFFASSSEAGIYLQNHSYVGCEATNNIYGFIFQNATQCAVRNCRSDNNLDPVSGTVGEGFTDVGLSITNTPAAVLQSSSLFEFNHAYNNGLGTAYSGINQNYNIFVNAGLTLTPPLLEGQVSTATYTYVNPVTYTPVHNISMIK